MLYDPILVQPMRDELTRLGVRELRSAEEVDGVLGLTEGTTLIVVNSVCGCAAASARPAVALALEHDVRPDRLVTVFAGQDEDATARAREYLVGFRPSSPSIALQKNGELVFMLERHQIEGREAEEIALELKTAFDTLCTRETAATQKARKLGGKEERRRTVVDEEWEQIARFEDEGGAGFDYP